MLSSNNRKIMIKQKQQQNNHDYNDINNNNNNINNEINNTTSRLNSINKKNEQQQINKMILINDEIIIDNNNKDIDGEQQEQSTAASTLTMTTGINRRDSTNRKTLWSKIALKFRFVQHFMKRSRENNTIKQRTPPSTTKDVQFNLSLSTNPSSSTSRSDLKSTGSIKYVDSHSRHISYLERTLSSRSYCNELRSRIKSDCSDKDSCSCTDDASNDYTTSLFEINSNSQLNTPNSIKCSNKFNDYLFLVNSDNETIDLFNKNDKSLTTYIDTTLSNTAHSVRTPVDVAATNSHLFVSDWLNDEVLVYNYDGQLQNILLNNQHTKCFSAPWGVAVDAVTDYLYVCNTAKNTIDIFDSRLQYYQSIGKSTSPTTFPIVQTSTSTTTTPQSVVFSKQRPQSIIDFHTPKWLINCDNWGFAVSDWDSNEIKLIDRTNNQLIRTIRDCYNPEGLTLLERTGTQLLVLCSHHKNILKMFDILSGRLIKTYDLFSSNEQKYEQSNNTLCSIYGLRGLCYSNEKIYFTDSIKNKIFICNL